MRYGLVLLCLLTLGSGCANVTTMKMHRSTNGDISIDSGKDVSFDALGYASPTGEQLYVSGYSSNANAAAINAQALREQQMIDGLIKAIQAGAALKP